MGTFRVGCRIENVGDRTRGARIAGVLVDTGSERTWIAEETLQRIGVAEEKKDVPFIMANGQQVTRSMGFAVIRVDQFFTVDEVVFARKGDLALLGARTLEGLNLLVDSTRKKLVGAGPHPAA